MEHSYSVMEQKYSVMEQSYSVMELDHTGRKSGNELRLEAASSYIFY